MVPFNDVLNSKQLVKAYEVRISGHKLCVDLIMLKLQDYDVILGMDWLSKHHAKIDCKKKNSKSICYQEPLLF